MDLVEFDEENLIRAYWAEQQPPIPPDLRDVVIAGSEPRPPWQNLCEIEPTNFIIISGYPATKELIKASHSLIKIKPVLDEDVRLGSNYLCINRGLFSMVLIQNGLGYFGRYCESVGFEGPGNKLTIYYRINDLKRMI